MKALVLTSYGDPETCIEYQTVAEPEAPGAGEVLVQLGFAPINFSLLIHHISNRTVLTMVTLHTNHGDIVIETFDEKAPVTVQNFLAYCRSGFYDNTIFHRVIKGFMIQGGGFEPGMIQKTTRNPIKNEADNGLKNDRGTLAMARTDDPHSATAQFFINLVDNGFLNFKSPSRKGWGYCVFGKVTEGMDVVDQIRKVATGSSAGHQDVPKEDVVIRSVTVD